MILRGAIFAVDHSVPELFDGLVFIINMPFFKQRTHAYISLEHAGYVIYTTYYRALHSCIKSRYKSTAWGHTLADTT